MTAWQFQHVSKTEQPRKMSLSEGTLCFVHWVHPQTLIMSPLHWSVTNCVTFSWKFSSLVKYETGHCMTHSTQSLQPFWLCSFWFLFFPINSVWNERCPEWTPSGFTALPEPHRFLQYIETTELVSSSHSQRNHRFCCVCTCWFLLPTPLTEPVLEHTNFA